MIPNKVYALIEEQRKQIQALSDKLDSVCRTLEERDRILFQIKDAIALSPKAKNERNACVALRHHMTGFLKLI